VTVAGNSVLASVDVTGLATAATFEPDGDTAAGDNAAIGYTAAEGLILTGQGSTSDITFKNDADATVMSIPTGTTNVGIGTTAPTAKLEITGGIKLSGQLLAGTSGSVYSPKVYAAYVAGTSILLLRNLNGNNRIDSYNEPISATYPLAINSSVCKFIIADSEKMRLDANGNVGVGTTTIFSPGGADASVVQLQSARYPQYIAQATAGATDEKVWRTIVRNGTTYEIQALNDAADAETDAIKITRSGMTISTIYLAGNVGIGTAAPGTKLQVDNSGVAILAKNTNTSNLSTPALQVSKGDNNDTTSNVFVQFFINGVAAGQGQINGNGGSAVAFGSFSDRRLKENIVNLPPQLANIMTLRPVEFDYIESEGSGHQLGFIAQEVQEIYPDLVGEREDGMLTLSDLNKNDARLIKAIQEQQALIEALTARITTLEG
jgi:hypothetical protein